MTNNSIHPKIMLYLFALNKVASKHKEKYIKKKLHTYKEKQTIYNTVEVRDFNLLPSVTLLTSR